MSFEAVLWATSDAPIADVNEFAVLVMLAEKADADGCNTFPSRTTIAARTKIDPRTVLRCLQRLEERGLIGRGDQRAAEYIRADRRPTVYDLLIPYSWFPNVERINEERQERGLTPLTAKSRPDLAPAPVKKKRSDSGQKRVKPRGDSQSPRSKDSSTAHGVTTSPPRGDYKSATGCLEDTRTSPLNQSMTLSPNPAAPADPSAPAEAVTEERETSPTGHNNHPGTVPAQRQEQGEQQHDVAAAFTAALPGRLGSRSVRRLALLVAAAFSAGWTEEALRAELARRVDVSRILNASAIPGLYERALEDLPASPAARHTAAPVDPCPQHPHKERADCKPCADEAVALAADEDQLYSGMSMADFINLAQAKG